MLIDKVLPEKPLSSAQDVDTLLELAYLVTAVDGRLDDDELDAYRHVCTRLRGKAATEEDVDALLERFGGRVDEDEIQERVRELAPTVPPELRELALKLIVALSIADLDESPKEVDLRDILVESLGLTAERASDATDAVFKALATDTDD